MGTRSLLGFVKEDGTVHVQYMQFDGGPQTKGRQFFEAVTRSIHEFQCEDDNGRPDQRFFDRVKHFLDDYQYQSGHSVGAQYTEARKDWGDLDYGAEWKYLWERNGDFLVTSEGRPQPSTDFEMVIPWGLTRELSGLYNLRMADEFYQSRLAPFWECLEAWGYPEEEKKLKTPTLSVKTFELHAFPGRNGWRHEQVANVMGRKVTGGPLSTWKGARRNEKKFLTRFHSEWQDVQKAKDETLPALMGKIKTNHAKEYLERRLAA